MQCPVSGLVAQTPRFLDEEELRVAFVDEDEVEDEDEGLQDAGEVFSPAPAEGGVDYEGGRDYRACSVLVYLS